MSLTRNPRVAIVILLCLLATSVLFTGCTTSTLPPNTTGTTVETFLASLPTPQPVPTPNPYGLDIDGYYIADREAPHGDYSSIYDRTKHAFDKKLKKEVITFNDTPNFTVQLLTPTISSGGSLLFEGTTTHPPNSIIYMIKNPGDTRPGVGSTGVQNFFAPVLPGSNGTNIIKFKIPALDIHIDQYTHPDPLFPANDTYTGYISVGNKGFVFNITSDPNYPMIWDSNSRWHYTWIWTNDTAIEHTTHTYNESETANAQPCPTYPKLPNTIIYPTLTPTPSFCVSGNVSVDSNC